jgi:hypothetical protein
VTIISPQRVSGGKQGRGSDIHQAVDQTSAARSAVGFAPVRKPGDCGTDGGRETDAHRKGRRSPHPRFTIRRHVKSQCCRPGTERKVSEYWMKGMTEPDAMKRILRALTGRSHRLVRAADRFA